VPSNKLVAHIKQWLEFKDRKLIFAPALTRCSTNNLSLNANTNVRNMFLKNIYTPGGLGLGKEGGGCAWKGGAYVWLCFGSVD